MRLVVASLVALVLAPAAGAGSLLYATDQVARPAQVVRVGIDGHGAKTIVATHVLDRAPDGSIATAKGDSLLVDGTIVATVGWPVDDARFAPDGRTLAFTAGSTAKCTPSATDCATWELWLVGTDGSGKRELTADGRYPRFSPDGRYLAFLGGFSPENEGGTAVAQNLATGKRTWFTYATDAPPVWAPRGDRLAYSSGRIRIATPVPRRVETLARGTSPVFSPDGRRVAYASLKGLVVAGRLVAPGAEPGFLWAPSGWLVYVKHVSNYPENDAVFRVRPDGSRRGLVHAYAPSATFSLLSSTAKTVTFELDRNRYSIATIDRTDLVTGATSVYEQDSGDDQSPAASAGAPLAYMRGSSTRWAWYCLSVNGACALPAKTVDGVREPVWSPDGRSIAAIDYAAHGARNLVVVTWPSLANRVVHVFHGLVLSPSWSADGRTIAVVTSDGTPDNHLHLWQVDIATGATSELATGEGALAAKYAPDGGTIAFVGGPWGGPYRLELLDLSTGAIDDLGVAAGSARPAWSPDGSQIAYQSPDNALHVVGRDGLGDRVAVRWAVAGSALAWIR